MRNMMQLLGGVAVAGVVAAGSAAFTASGVSGGYGPTTFIGGKASQTINGATLSSIDYDFADAGANTQLNKITLTFGDNNTDSKVPTIALTGGSFTTAASFTCEAVDATTDNVSVCTPTGGTGYYGPSVATVEVTVPN